MAATASLPSDCKGIAVLQSLTWHNHTEHLFCMIANWLIYVDRNHLTVEKRGNSIRSILPELRYDIKPK